MKTENPGFIATHEFIWVKRDGSEVPVQVLIGTPYCADIDWACASALMGIDGRNGDIFGVSALQAMCLAVRFVHARLAHLLDTGEILLHDSEGRERVDAAGLAVLFGRGVS